MGGSILELSFSQNESGTSFDQGCLNYLQGKLSSRIDENRPSASQELANCIATIGSNMILNFLGSCVMVSRILTALGIVMFFPSLVPAQQSVCKVDIPVGVIGINGDTFRGLTAEDFVGQIQKKPVAVKNVTFDDGPRRVLIVADANKKLSADLRKAEDEMIKTLLASARPQDTFAIMPAHGPGQDVKFTEDRAAIREALNQPGEGRRGKDPSVRDTLLV